MLGSLTFSRNPCIMSLNAYLKPSIRLETGVNEHT